MAASTGTLMAGLATDYSMTGIPDRVLHAGGRAAKIGRSANYEDGSPW